MSITSPTDAGTDTSAAATRRNANRSGLSRIARAYFRFNISRRVPRDRRQDAALLAILFPLIALLEIALAFGNEVPENALAEATIILVAVGLTLIPWLLLRFGQVDAAGLALGLIITGTTTASLLQPLPNGTVGLIWAAVPGLCFLGLGALISGITTRFLWALLGFAAAVAGLLAVVLLMPQAPSLIQEEIASGAFPATLPVAEQAARTTMDVLMRPGMLLFVFWLIGLAARNTRIFFARNTDTD